MRIRRRKKIVPMMERVISYPSTMELVLVWRDPRVFRPENAAFVENHRLVAQTFTSTKPSLQPLHSVSYSSFCTVQVP